MGERKQAAKMRAVSDRQFGEPSDLEQLFLECVEKVRDEISGRKKIFHEQNERQKKGDRASEKAKAQAAKAGGAPTNASPKIALEDFTVADRRKVVDLLLSSEQVLQFLYDKLFPAGSEAGLRAGESGEF